LRRLDARGIHERRRVNQVANLADVGKVDQDAREVATKRAKIFLARALRARPAGSELLSIVDYLYLSQLPPLLFATNAWQHVRHCLGGAPDGKSLSRDRSRHRRDRALRPPRPGAPALVECHGHRETIWAARNELLTGARDGATASFKLKPERTGQA
jgi:hypothetical protein